MAGTASIEQRTFQRGRIKKTARVASEGSIHVVEWTLLSSAYGSVDAPPVTNVAGFLQRVTVHPSDGAVPTDAFDIYLYDIAASRDLGYSQVDLLASAGENRPNSIASQIIPTNPPLSAGKVLLVARNMGDAKKCRVVAYIE